MKKQTNRDLLITLITEQKENYYRLAFSYVKNEQDALDVVQDAIKKSLLSVEYIREPKAMKSWFYKIVVRTSLDLLRKRKKYVPMSPADMSLYDAGKEDHYQNLDLHQALDSLQYQYKTILLLRYYEGFKLDEIADILDENISTVKTRLYRAHTLLRNQLNEK